MTKAQAARDRTAAARLAAGMSTESAALRAAIAEQKDAMPDAAWFAAFRRRLKAWYPRAARALPWRATRDPYAIWLSEVMLQQTQVATVTPYYERFLAELPTIAALAAAAEARVLRLWEGLGYYRRARQLHRAAQAIVAQHDGAFPRDAATVRRLPGVGRYTAGAVLSFAFDQRQPIVEANTQRLYARLLGFPQPVHTPAAQALLWQFATAALPQRGAGTMNQAMIELGATVCLPRQPRCAECPAASLCRARAAGVQHAIPLAKAKAAATAVREAAALILCDNRVLVARRGEGGRWAGLWDFPRFAIDAESPAALQEELRAKCRAAVGVEVCALEHAITLRHAVTRFRITLECFVAQAVLEAPPAEEENRRWLRPSELSQIPLSVTGRKLADWLTRHCDPVARRRPRRDRPVP